VREFAQDPKRFVPRELTRAYSLIPTTVSMDYLTFTTLKDHRR